MVVDYSFVIVLSYYLDNLNNFDSYSINLDLYLIDCTYFAFQIMLHIIDMDLASMIAHIKARHIEADFHKIDLLEYSLETQYMDNYNLDFR